MFRNPTPSGAARRRDAQVNARELVREYDRRHGEHADLWVLGEVLLAILRAGWWVLRIAARFPVVTLIVALLGYGYWEFGQVGPALVCAVLLVGLVSWRLVDGDSFSQFVTWRVWSSWRAWRTYGRHWDSAMTMAGLGDRYLGDDYVPVLLRAKCRPDLDRLTVQLLQGQHPDDFAAQADTLAHTFGALACRSRIAGPGVITLDFTKADRLAELVPALDVTDTPDLAAVAFGAREDGRAMTAKVRGSHTLVAGATGAGKGSVLWSLIRGLGPLVRDRLVELWVCDPKGGMELSAGEPLFARFAYATTDDMASLLEDAVAEMRARAGRLRGKVRLHTPTTDEPLIVVVVDEMAALTAYATDRDERKRISAALSLLLSQGRAVGVVVVAALQDPRKEVLQQRDLFPTRIALRLIEREATDMVLGPGARDRGAACDRIDPSTPGVGFMWCDGEAEPTRFRAAYVTDDDIAQMVEQYRPGSGPVPVPADAQTDDPAPGGGVVIDLADMARGEVPA
jgi:DNA segregation ATPase FtsK/SpoIIIE, S-DNA-T family